MWLVAVLLDKNRVFPKWFGYLSLCNALTEVVVAPAWIFQRGAFAWNGAIAWWINMVVFVLYTGVFIVLLRKMIEREDFGTGPLPDLPGKGAAAHRRIQWRRFDDECCRCGFTRSSRLEEKPAKFVPGQPDMWMFVLFESLLFTGYFSVYLDLPHPESGPVSAVSGRPGSAHRRLQHHRPAAQLVGDRALRPRQRGQGAYRSALRNAFLTIFFGLVFLVSKVLEWVKEIDLGNTFTSNEFFQHYFFLTSIHCIHVLIGFVVLGVVVYQLWSPASALPAACRNVRHLLAHRRLPVGPDLCVALRREVICELPHSTRDC